MELRTFFSVCPLLEVLSRQGDSESPSTVRRRRPREGGDKICAKPLGRSPLCPSGLSLFCSIRDGHDGPPMPRCAGRTLAGGSFMPPSPSNSHPNRPKSPVASTSPPARPRPSPCASGPTNKLWVTVNGLCLHNQRPTGKTMTLVPLQELCHFISVMSESVELCGV